MKGGYVKAELVQIDGSINKGKYWAIKLTPCPEYGRITQTTILRCPEHHYTNTKEMKEKYQGIVNAINGTTTGFCPPSGQLSKNR